MKEELTWKDIKTIVKIAEHINPTHDTELIISEFHSEEAFYGEVLKRFREGKK